MEHKTCSTCNHWVIDINNKQDRSHAEQNRKLCALLIGEMAKGTYFYGETVACRKYSDNERGYKVG